LVFADNSLAAELYGEGNATLRVLEDAFGIRVNARGNRVHLTGPEESVVLGRKVLENLYGVLRGGSSINIGDVRSAVGMLTEKPDIDLKSVQEGVVPYVGYRRRIAAKNLAQKKYLELMSEHDLVFGFGPAGTGKTYLAMAMAISALEQRHVSKVILARPAVEAGEKLGFLPGSMEDKVNPYLRPLYDALNDMMEFSKATRYMERGQIEVAPLAFMRGRTLSDAFVILDEAQNSTAEQMKMFLTRLGENSKAVVTGDVTQIDLPGGATSGLVEATEILEGIDGISVMRFTDADVVRHPLVGKIVRAYDKYEERTGKGNGASGRSARGRVESDE
jgi:phosphate starvation-inducible PhoH-like protein